MNPLRLGGTSEPGDARFTLLLVTTHTDRRARARSKSENASARQDSSGCCALGLHWLPSGGRSQVRAAAMAEADRSSALKVQRDEFRRCRGQRLSRIVEPKHPFFPGDLDFTSRCCMLFPAL